MTRLARGVVGVCSLVALLAGTAQAIPPIFDKVPADAAITIAVPNTEGFEKDLQTVSGWVGMPLPVQGVDQMLSMMGIEAGVTKGGSVAIVMFDAPSPEMDGPPNMFVLLPISDYAGFLKNFDAKPSGGIDQISISGDDAFLRDIGGGYVVMAPTKAIAEKYDAKGGHAAAHKKSLGAAGEKLADTADLVFVVNAAKVRPLVERGIKEVFSNINDNAAMMGEGAPNFAAVEWIVNLAVKDTRTVVAGATIDGMGVGLDMVLAFDDGSRMAKLTSKPGAASSLLGKLPNQPYLAAFAMDFSNPELKSLIAEMPQAGKAQPGAMDSKFLAAKTSGVATSLGYNPGGIMAGLFTRGVTFTATADPAAYIGELKKAMDEIKKAGIGEASYTENAADVGGTKVDAWEMKMNADPDNPMIQQMMMLMFGAAGGPNGYTARTDTGIIQTMSKSSDLMAAAMAAVKGENSLGGDKLTTQVGDKMPKNRVAEVFLGSKSIFDSVSGLLSMFGGMQVKVDIPQSLPPIGMGLAPSDGALQTSIFVPGSVIQTTSKFIRAVQEGAAGGRGGGGAAPKKDDSGQPKF